MDLDKIKGYEAKAKGILDDAAAFLKFAQGDGHVQKIAAEFPAAKQLLERAVGAIPVVGEIEAVIAGLATAYALAQYFGLKPMDANEMAAQDEKFHEGYSAD